MHADRPGERPRLLYWYRSAPGIVLGRAALDEEAIRAIEDQHPGIDFDWPAILALREVMIPEDEAPAPRPPQHQQRREKKPRGRDRDRDRDRESRPRENNEAPVSREAMPESLEETSASAPIEEPEELRRDDRGLEPPAAVEPGLVDELAGREIASRLRARYAEVVARIEALDVDGEAREAWFKRAEAIDPDAWDSPDAVLRGVSQADALFEKLKAELA